MTKSALPFVLRVLVTLALAAIGALFVVRMVAMFPLEHDVTAEHSTGDDWLSYDRYATSVLSDGLTIPIVDGAYTRPAGFAYVYFIALIYAVAGARSEAVYLVQGLLLIAGVVGMYAVFRPALSRLAASVLLLALAVFMYIDVYRSLTFRLLSENLLFPLFPALLMFVMKGDATSKVRYVAAGGALSGLCFLVRPNLFLLGPGAAAAILLFSSQPSLAWRARAAASLLGACMLVAALLPLRDYAATGRTSVAMVATSSDWSVVRYQQGTAVSVAERVERQLRRAAGRAAYLVGIPQFMQPTFRLRPHWLVMWSACLWYLYKLIGRTPQFWEALVVAAAVFYFGPILAVGNISNYAVRMLAPGLPLILVLAAKGLDRGHPGC